MLRFMLRQVSVSEESTKQKVMSAFAPPGFHRFWRTDTSARGRFMVYSYIEMTHYQETLKEGTVKMSILDSQNYLLEVAQKVTPTGGIARVEFVREGYFNSLKSMCRCALNKHPRVSGVRGKDVVLSPQDLLSAVKDSEARVLAALKTFFNDGDPLSDWREEFEAKTEVVAAAVAKRKK